jgi:hypothetical protein
LKKGEVPKVNKLLSSLLVVLGLFAPGICGAVTIPIPGGIFRGTGTGPIKHPIGPPDGSDFTPVALVSGIVPLGTSPDPTTGWPIHNQANIALTAVKTGKGLTVVKLQYSDTQGLTFSGATTRQPLQITPLTRGSSTPSELKITMTSLVKYGSDQVTLHLKYVGEDTAGNPVFNVILEAWDAAHAHKWVGVYGQFAPAISDVEIAPEHHGLPKH